MSLSKVNKTSVKSDFKELDAMLKNTELSDSLGFNQELNDLDARIDDITGATVSDETIEGISVDIAELKGRVEVSISEVECVSKLKDSYTVKVIKISYGGSRVLKGGSIVKTVRYGEDTIKEWLSKGLIG